MSESQYHHLATIALATRVDHDKPYLSAFERLFRDFLKDRPAHAQELWRALRHIDDSPVLDIEEAARKAGFILGFEYANPAEPPLRPIYLEGRLTCASQSMLG